LRGRKGFDNNVPISVRLKPACSGSVYLIEKADSVLDD